jgi:magnesium transporter
MKWTKTELDDAVIRHVRGDFVSLDHGLTVGQALDEIRRRGPGDKPIYFYVVDGERRLAGVLPVRSLLALPADARIEDGMRRDVVAIPESFTVLEACELFATHRLLALPVVDADRRLLGVVDVSLLTDELFDLHEREQMDAFFETLGVRLYHLRDATPRAAFRSRFPWMLATVASGLVCALVAGAFERTLAESLVLAFFLTLLLGLGESVSIQTMTLMVHRLRGERPGWDWYRGVLGREMLGTLLLGAACGAVVGSFVLLWKGDAAAAGVVGGGIVISLVGACFVGVSVPSLLHVLKLDLKIAAGPVALGTVDIWTILSYLGLARLVLGP